MSTSTASKNTSHNTPQTKKSSRTPPRVEKASNMLPETNKPLSLKDAVRALLEFENAPPDVDIHIEGESHAVMGWCLIARAQSGRLLFHLDARCNLNLVSETGLLLKAYPEIELLPDPIWIEGRDYVAGTTALEKYRDHISAEIAKSQEVSGSSPTEEPA